MNLDLERDPDTHPNLVSVAGDIRDAALVGSLFAQHGFDAVFHCAAQLAHGARIDEQLLWTSNVDGTRVLAEQARAAGAAVRVHLLQLPVGLRSRPSRR